MRKRRTAAFALPVAAAVLLAGCGSSGSGSTGGGSAPANTAGAITVDGSQPENPLIPGNTNETGGGRVITSLFTQLVRYNTDTAAPELAVAKSIDSSDAQNFDVKLNPGWMFHDGTPVNAKSFVDAWNWVAYAPNGALNSSFMAEIAGYDALNPADPDGKAGPLKAPTPTTKEMTGLKVVSDTEFTIALTAPYSPFKAKLGYTAFAPLPTSFFADPAAFGRKPIGNGPFKFVEWNDNASIKLTRFDNYAGTKPSVKDVTFKLYQDQNAAYADLRSDNLDFQQVLPTSALAGEQYKTDLNGRFVNKDVLVVQTVSFPLYDARFQNAKLRQAISAAINRDQITKVIFNSTRTPSTSWSSPGVGGYVAGTCGGFCTYDPAKAKALLAEAGGFTGQLTLSYNADGDHKAWTEATCNSIKDAIGIDCVATPVPTFADFRKQINAKSMTGMFRTGWQYDFPNIENGLTPLYSTGASSNDSKYSNPTFDKALTAAAANSDLAAANKAFADAEKMLAADLPAIPLWSVKQQSGFSTKVSNVKVDAFGVIDLDQVTVNK